VHMPDSIISINMLIQILDLFGTMAFAVTGAFKAIEHNSDIVGIVILSTITGLAGGVMRDIIFGKFPPTAVVNSLYVIITVSSGIVIFSLSNTKETLEFILKFDALGLGVFTLIGSASAYNVFGLNFLAMSFGGVLTAVGGGILRDVFVSEIPLVFTKEFYASASFLGVIVLFIMLSLGVNLTLASIPAIMVVTAIRLVAMKYNWNMPHARN
ncbi:MAG TPA: trimeric intracellular cation channel family protein, partial [Nitrososphaeraceae archaeon]|nr:trimeric intracellular cation channel family protein [Nitrososphaeraceae archaeon]